MYTFMLQINAQLFLFLIKNLILYVTVWREDDG